MKLFFLVILFSLNAFAADLPELSTLAGNYQLTQVFNKNEIHTYRAKIDYISNVKFKNTNKIFEAIRFSYTSTNEVFGFFYLISDLEGNYFTNSQGIDPNFGHALSPFVYDANDGDLKVETNSYTRLTFKALSSNNLVLSHFTRTCVVPAGPHICLFYKWVKTPYIEYLFKR